MPVRRSRVEERAIRTPPFAGRRGGPGGRCVVSIGAVSLTSQLRDGPLAAWCTKRLPGATDVARAVAARSRGARPVFPQGQVGLDHWAAIGGAFGARLAALVQPAPPYYALYGLLRADLARRDWADAEAARWPTHAHLPDRLREMALDVRPTSVGWLSLAATLSAPEAPVSEARRVAAALLGTGHTTRPTPARRYPAEPVLADLFERTRDYLARYARPGQLGPAGAEAGLARTFWLFNLFEEVYRAGRVTEPVGRLFATGAPSVESMRSAASGPVVAELVALAQRLTESGALDELRALAGGPGEGEPLGVAGPVFVNHWADGDLVLTGPEGATLVDVKTVAKTSDLDRSVRWLWQLVGYAWLDAADRYRIRRLGLYLARHGVLLTWPLEELVGALVGGRDPDEARAEFRAEAARALAGEGATTNVADLPATPGPAPVPPAPRTGGLYVSPGPESARYLRFAGDGQVLGVTSTGNPEQVARWLKPGGAHFGAGAYRLDWPDISFIMTVEQGRVSYRGFLTHDASQLVLTVHSGINGHRARYVYTYTPVAAEA